jgi:hypothetical protein
MIGMVMAEQRDVAGLANGALERRWNFLLPAITHAISLSTK